MSLIKVYKKIVKFLNEEGVPYMIIGGFAAGILGEPRATVDIDIDIMVRKSEAIELLKKLKKQGFEVDIKECKERIKRTGTFQIEYNDYNIDFIISSIELERKAIARSRILKVHGVNARFPTPEDLILLKIISGRPKDIADAESIVIRHSRKLDRNYLLKWAEKISDEMESLRVYREIKNLLRRYCE